MRTQRPSGLRRGRGFTLIELLVVIAIIGLLVSILLPSLSRARQQAKSLICKTNIKGISTGAYTYTADFGRFPPNLASLRDVPALYARAGEDWLGIGGCLGANCAYIPGDPNDPTTGQPQGFDASPRFGKIWPYVMDEKAYLCPEDQGTTYEPGTLTGGGGNGKFSYSMFANMGLRAPDMPHMTRCSTSVSGGPRGGGASSYRLPPTSLSNTPLFAEEHPSGISLRGGTHLEGNFNYDTDYVTARHPPFEKRPGIKPGAAGPGTFTQGATNIGYADGHVDTVKTNYGFTWAHVDSANASYAGFPGCIPYTANGLLSYYGLEYQEVLAQPRGGLKYAPQYDNDCDPNN